MLFMGHHEDDGWLLSTFNLTFRASWEMMLQGVYGLFIIEGVVGV